MQEFNARDQCKGSMQDIIARDQGKNMLGQRKHIAHPTIPLIWLVCTHTSTTPVKAQHLTSPLTWLVRTHTSTTPVKARKGAKPAATVEARMPTCPCLLLFLMLLLPLQCQISS